MTPSSLPAVSRFSGAPRPTASVIIPAHNEERSLFRLLDALAGAQHAELQVVVVCNGCTDATASIAREHKTQSLVIETPTPSKPQAMELGNQAATMFPRLFVDADVVIDITSVRLIVKALSRDGIHAAGPERLLDLDGASWPVRAYYAVWSRLDAIREGLYGRGVVALDEEGVRRMASVPDVMGDDLYLNNLFAPNERAVVPGAHVTIRCPRTLPDLVRRRIRTSMGNAEQGSLERDAVHPAVGASAPTSFRHVFAVAQNSPRLIPCIPVFVLITVWSRVAAARRRRHGDNSWLRDESSR